VPGVTEHLLVNRGWIAAGGDRRVLPDVTPLGGARRVTGRLDRLPRPALRLGASAPSGRAAGAVVLQYPTAEELAAALGGPVLDYQLLLDPAEPGGYVREWRAPGVPPERNLGYAGQWFALAIGAVAAAGVMVWRTTRRKPYAT
jgi:surfeit locus 1 family protein